ncbi:caM kinase-like vesicle-associated protein [Chelonoidis abingdonii]|uniref:caM kinase-like vesicle-associated protein n=1 Tax=Chelonoidis abingdonii TaxID=106734 RepID=UPI003F49A6C0
MPWGCLQLREEKNYSSVGDIMDKYEIGELLSAKEFCELCLARERRTDRLVVCKRFRKKDGRKVRQAARNEILILKMVSHPNILQLIDTFETRREFYIIQELATGGDVFDWILDLGCYTERDASSLIRQVLEALAYLHSLHIVHRNLKLENLVYHTQQSRAKVVLRDFYLSRFENGAITEPCGTPEYLGMCSPSTWANGYQCFIPPPHGWVFLCPAPPRSPTSPPSPPHILTISPPPISPASATPTRSPRCILLLPLDTPGHRPPRIAGNVASEKNLKEGVCAQIEKNFAKAKWRKAIRVTTFMQRLRALEPGAHPPAPLPEVTVEEPCPTEPTITERPREPAGPMEEKTQ